MTLKQVARSFVLVLLAPGIGSAAPLTWTLDGTTNADGVAVSGTLAYDAEESIFGHISLVVRLNSLILRTFEAENLLSSSGGTRLILAEDVLGNSGTQRFYLDLDFAPGLSSAQDVATFSGTFATGLLVLLNNPPHCVTNNLGHLECDPWTGGWNGWIASRIDQVAGIATASETSNPPGGGTGVVPEPTALLLLGIGLFRCATGRRSRRGPLALGSGGAGVSP